jgi:hypothetical protein
MLPIPIVVPEACRSLITASHHKQPSAMMEESLST